MDGAKLPPPDGLEGQWGSGSLEAMVSKVAITRMSSIGFASLMSLKMVSPGSLRAVSGVIAHSLGNWRVEVEGSMGKDRGTVRLLCLSASGEWEEQDATDGSPALTFVERGQDPESRSSSYHYVNRVTHYSMGHRWDQSPSSPSEKAWREDGTIWWTRRFLRGQLSDRGVGSPALRSYWATGNLQLERYASLDSSPSSPSSFAPSYAEFYPNGNPAVEVSSGDKVQGYLPNGSSLGSHVLGNAPGIAQVFAASTQVDFDPFRRPPYTAFLDVFPDGDWRLHRSLHPPKPKKGAFLPPSAAHEPTRPLLRNPLLAQDPNSGVVT